MSDGKQSSLLRVGEVARRTGKTVRAIHLYEELGLLKPASRSAGGFRLYRADAIERVGWITKLQAIGFSLNEIQGFVSEFENASSGRDATSRVRDVFRAKAQEVEEQIASLETIKEDLKNAIAYLESCRDCSTEFTTDECGTCEHHGHQPEEVPDLFTPLTRATRAAPERSYDVAVARLKRDSR